MYSRFSRTIAFSIFLTVAGSLSGCCANPRASEQVSRLNKIVQYYASTNPVFAESTTRFFLKAMDAQVEFFTDDKGRVTHLTLRYRGRDYTGAKAP